MALTVSSVRTKFELIKKDISDVSNDLFIFWSDQINKFVYRTLYQVDPERYIQEQDYTVTGSPQTSTLPTDFRDLKSFGCGVFLKNDDGTTTQDFLPIVQYGSQARGYYITGSNIVFTGIEDSSFRLRYMPELPTIDSTDDTFIIPDEFEWYLIQALDVYYNMWDEMPGAEALSDQRFTRVLDELVRHVRKDVPNYPIYDFTQDYSGPNYPSY